MPLLFPLDRWGLRISSLELIFFSPPVGCWRVRGPSPRAHEIDLFLWPETPVSQQWVSGWCHGSTRSNRQASKKTILSFWGADDGVTQSLGFPDDILIGCEVHEYRRRIVDPNVMGLMPREVAQEAMIPTNSLTESS